MTEISTEIVEVDHTRSRGRPQVRSDADTLHLIAEAAREEFMNRGFAGTSMDTVARNTGISKKTLYRLVPTKALLFEASVIDRIHAFLSSFDRDELADMPLEAGMEKLLTEFGNLTLSAGTIAIQKLVVSESSRFPELAATFHREAISATHAIFSEFLAAHVRRGGLVVDDPREAAGMLRGMMLTEPQNAVMMGLRAPPSEEEIARRARACGKLFLLGALGRR